jgi:hypothetical protein
MAVAFLREEAAPQPKRSKKVSKAQQLKAEEKEATVRVHAVAQYSWDAWGCLLDELERGGWTMAF